MSQAGQQADLLRPQARAGLQHLLAAGDVLRHRPHLGVAAHLAVQGHQTVRLVGILHHDHRIGARRHGGSRRDADAGAGLDTQVRDVTRGLLADQAARVAGIGGDHRKAVLDAARKRRQVFRRPHVFGQDEVQGVKGRVRARREARRLSEDDVQCDLGFYRVVVAHEGVRSAGESRRGSGRTASPQRSRIVSQIRAARKPHPDGRAAQAPSRSATASPSATALRQPRRRSGAPKPGRHDG